VADNQAFGGNDRYYASESPNGPGVAFGACARELSEVLLQHDPDLPSKVERAFTQWNGILRDYLRNETGLRLSVGEDKRAVPVRISGGLPLPLNQVLEELSDPTVWYLYLQRRTISSATVGLDLVSTGYGVVESWFENGLPASQDDVDRTLQLFKKLEGWLNALELLKKIGAIEQDILGAYFFRIPEVRLYWMVIGLIAGALQVSVEALTFVVAAHELAHAYTHLGRDIDGRRWDVDVFSRTDSKIVEGLAQFYTRMICEKIKDRFPAAVDAYTRLVAIQTGPYRAHLDWGGTEDSTGEVVRFAMIEARSRNIEHYGEYQKELEEIRKRTARSRKAAVVSGK